MSQEHNHSNIQQKMEIEEPYQNQNKQPMELQQNQDQEIPLEFEELNEEQYEEYLEQVEENTKKIINNLQQDQDPNEKDEEEFIQPVKNPVSAYLVFTMKWKKDNPTQKFSMPHLGDLWKGLEPHQKRQFEEEFRKQKQKYDLYVTSKLMKNPGAQKQLDAQNKFFFPLHRIRAIMKQDKFYSPKTESVAAMARATEYFGEYFLEELKKITEGKNRIDTKDLFQCISANSRIFGFLDCLIDDYALSSKEKKSLKLVNEEEQGKQREPQMKQQSEKKKPNKPVKQNSNIPKPLPKGQSTLTDMFGFSRNK